MSPWDGAGGVRRPETADFFPNPLYGNALPLSRCSRDGKHARPPHRVTRETSMRAGLAYRLVDHISVSEIGRPAHGGVGAGSSSHDGEDNITSPEQRTRTLEMLCRARKDWHEFLPMGGSP